MLNAIMSGILAVTMIVTNMTIATVNETGMEQAQIDAIQEMSFVEKSWFLDESDEIVVDFIVIRAPGGEYGDYHIDYYEPLTGICGTKLVEDVDVSYDEVRNMFAVEVDVINRDANQIYYTADLTMEIE